MSANKDEKYFVDKIKLATYKGGNDVCASLVEVARLAEDHGIDYEKTIQILMRDWMPRAVKKTVTGKMADHRPVLQNDAMIEVSGMTYIATRGNYSSNKFLCEKDEGDRHCQHVGATSHHQQGVLDTSDACGTTTTRDTSGEQ